MTTDEPTSPTLPSMSIMDAISKRTSVRSFTDARIDEATIRLLLHAAVRAPTAMHAEPWVFVIVQDPKLLKTIGDAAKTGFMAMALAAHVIRPDYDVFYNAGTLVAICAKPIGPFVDADCWLAAENLMLAATAVGLGTCCIGSSIATLNQPAIKAALGVPADVKVVAPIILGTPAAVPAPTPRAEPNILTWK